MPNSKSKSLQAKSLQRSGLKTATISTPTSTPAEESLNQPATELELPAISPQGVVNRQALTQVNILSLQNTVGNQAVQRLLSDRAVARSRETAPVIQRVLDKNDTKKFTSWLKQQKIELSSKELDTICSTAKSLQEAQELAVNGKENSKLDKMVSGSSLTNTLIGLGSGLVTGIVGAATVSNPVGWVVGGATALLVGGYTSYNSGEDYALKPHEPKQVKPQEKKINIDSPQSKGTSKEEEWKKFRNSYEQFEKDCVKVQEKVENTEKSHYDARTLYRKMLGRKSTIEALTSLSGPEFGKLYKALDPKLQEICPLKYMRSLAKTATDAEKLYGEFGTALDTFDSAPKFAPVSKKKFLGDAGVEIVKHQKYLIDYIKLAEIVEASFIKADEALTKQTKLEQALISASKQSDSQEAQQVVQSIAPVKDADWLAELYPHGYVQIIGDCYAAITKEGWEELGKLHKDAPAMYLDALNNGPIPDYGTGASGVKWGKGELKVRRTKLTSLEIASDMRLAGKIVNVENKEKTATVKVLELKTLINAH